MLSSRELEMLFRPLHGQSKIARYPLTNIGTDEKDNLFIEVAVAGFKKEEISIERKGNELHICGEFLQEDLEINYYQKHISQEPFKRVIVLHEKYVNGEINASVEDGILTIMVQPKEEEKSFIEIK